MNRNKPIFTQEIVKFADREENFALDMEQGKWSDSTCGVTYLLMSVLKDQDLNNCQGIDKTFIHTQNAHQHAYMSS